MYQRNRAFMRAIVPGRCLAVAMFWSSGRVLRGVAGFEAVTGLAMAGALWWEG